MTTITPTAETIRIARDAAQTDFLKFTVEPHGALENAFYVQREGERPVLVSPNPFADGDEDECQCAVFASKGFCQHLAAVELTREIDRQAEEYADREDGRLFMEQCRAERAPSVAPEPWPVCGFHGAHRASQSGEPMSFCERCWNR